MGDRSLKIKILLFLYSNKNIVGSILGIIGLILFFTGVIEKFWLPIVISLYFIGILGTPGEPQLEIQLGNPITVEEIKDSLESLIRTIKKKVSPDILNLVLSIKDSIFDILQDFERMNAVFDHNFFTIKQTVFKYLPSLIENYLKLPWSFRRVHVIKDGKTAHQILIEQLKLMDSKIKQIVVSIHENNTQELINNSKFLEDKFKEGDYFSI